MAADRFRRRTPKSMVTIPHLSKATGFSTYTVSCALRGVGRVAPRTREIVLETARRLGYQPNSAAAILVGQRRREVSGPLQVPVAMVGDIVEGVEGMGSGHFLAACAERGLEGRTLRLVEGERVAAQIEALWKAGVRGLYLQPVPATADALGRIDLSRFCVVKDTRAYPQLRFHLVRHSAFDYMMQPLRRVFGAGYRRVAVILTDSASEQDDLGRIGAVEAFRRKRMPPGAFMRLFHAADAEKPGAAALVARVLRWRPDAVIAFPFTWFYEFREAGVRMPGEIGFATVIAYRGLGNTPQLSGCDAADAERCRRAVAALYGLLQAGERGFASEPVEHVIEPVWVEGETLGERV